MFYRASKSDCHFRHNNIPGEIARDVAGQGKTEKTDGRDVELTKPNSVLRDKLFITVRDSTEYRMAGEDSTSYFAPQQVL